jgi:hypothetical protein
MTRESRSKNMIRKSIVALATITVLGTATIPLTPAGAAYFNDRTSMRNNIANNRYDWRRPRHHFAVRHPFARRHFVVQHPFARDRFAFRHPGRLGFASCSVVRRQWTPWGWRWRRVWVC